MKTELKINTAKKLPKDHASFKPNEFVRTFLIEPDDSLEDELDDYINIAIQKLARARVIEIRYGAFVYHLNELVADYQRDGTPPSTVHGITALDLFTEDEQALFDLMQPETDEPDTGWTGMQEIVEQIHKRVANEAFWADDHFGYRAVFRYGTKFDKITLMRVMSRDPLADHLGVLTGPEIDHDAE